MLKRLTLLLESESPGIRLVKVRLQFAQAMASSTIKCSTVLMSRTSELIPLTRRRLQLVVLVLTNRYQLGKRQRQLRQQRRLVFALYKRTGTIHTCNTGPLMSNINLATRP